MSTHKNIDRICLAGAILSLLLSLLFMNGLALGIQPASRVMGYEARLFDISRVHTIDIVMDDWDAFIDTCENEEYVSCAVVIDNEAYKNVGLRAKGNTSLSTVSQLGSDRYSFKIEFDHYDSGKTYYGLDKLSLNNAIQDNTLMKDYLTYRLMAEFGANAPLCSFVYITVNGEDWGLYLAIEAIEDGFLQRNYGRDHGALYKPDSLSFGGGRGNGRNFEGFDFDQFSFEDSSSGDFETSGFKNFRLGNFDAQNPDFGGFGGRGGGMGGGTGSSDTKLQYIDDNPDSYANIFDNAKTDVSQSDKARLIQSLKVLGEGGDISEAVDIDQVLRYFVVHNFVVNGDSYTGSMVHNYYLYEENEKLSMLPWDYNLAFGTFMGNNASSAVNDPIDTPLSVTGSGDRPMADWIFASEEYTRLYHQYFAEFLDTADPTAIIDKAYALIAPYVDQDPTKFCTREEFETGTAALKTFCDLRIQSVDGQLTGTIPSTSLGQSENRIALVDASSLNLADMGTMGGGGFGKGDAFGQSGDSQPAFWQSEDTPSTFGQSGATPPTFGQSGDNPPTFGQSGDNPPIFGTDMPSLPDGERGETHDRQFPGNGQRPDSGEAESSAGNISDGGPWNNAPASNTPQSGTALILLSLSSLILLVGLIIAFKFKR